jgi:hypothetical protein
MTAIVVIPANAGISNLFHAVAAEIPAQARHHGVFGVSANAVVSPRLVERVETSPRLWTTIEPVVMLAVHPRRAVRGPGADRVL